VTLPAPGWLTPHWPDLPANVMALATTRQAGASASPHDDGQGGGGRNLGVHVGDDPALVAQNRALVQSRVAGRLAWLSQVHGVAVVDAADAGDIAPVADASIAARPGAVCTIMTADCLPVLFADLAGKVVGGAHAGWRGLAAGVLQATVDAMRVAGAGEITAWLGPAIGPAAFEVGDDVRAAFLLAIPSAPDEVAAAFSPYPGRASKYLADMNALARLTLREVGVTRVWGGEHCTVTEADLFYSYRRDGVTGRQASLIWIKQ
jgi:YfiH family protein